MKQNLIKGLVVAGMALASVPALAQTKKDKSDKKDGPHQVTVINREGNLQEKTVIEIVGNKVTVNGKESGKDANVNVHVNTIDSRDHRTMMKSMPRAFSMTTDAPGSFFIADSNRAMLGINTDDHDKGAEIVSVMDETAASKAGLKKGDIITKIGTKRIDGAEDVTAAVRTHKPGDKVGITVLRDGKEQTVQAEFGKWKGMRISGLNPTIRMNDMNMNIDIDHPGAMIAPRSRAIFLNSNQPKLGLSVQDTEDGKGVKVTEVEEESNAAKAGVRLNDVITSVDDKEVNSADEIARALRSSREKATMKLQLLRDGKQQTIEVKGMKRLKTADL